MKVLSSFHPRNRPDTGNAWKCDGDDSPAYEHSEVLTRFVVRHTSIVWRTECKNALDPASPVC